MVWMAIWLQGAAKCYFILSTTHDVSLWGSQGVQIFMFS